MTTRSTADLLATIAEDVSEMASVAHSLDALTSELDLTHADQNKIRDLQRVDALFQHLDDVSVLLRKMSAMIGSGPDLDTGALSNAIRLDYLKSRLTENTTVAMAPAVSGDVNLF
ncbi:hypothetical protein BXY66_0272 [Shimia isoporae]|uniref:Uncharacterized protein n=1 Tax=Shimia isoporae TaxID=647720 RepID=A0A4R1NSK1_9RHOB|nr:hypothetical protein [Shimia isoporae]TCL08238.1 hypothetical protein BXY66_0272 [Shimia isoporae]